MKVILGLISAALAFLFYKNMTLQAPPLIGDQAPAFQLNDVDGQVHALADYSGEWIVLYFYPKDDTPGCTKEACYFRDQYKAFETLKVNILGVSLDDQDSHSAFKQKYQLPFTLLSDPDGNVASQYGALMHLGVTKFAKRYTFIIDPDGRVAHRDVKVDPVTHANELLEKLRQLTGHQALEND